MERGKNQKFPFKGKKVWKGKRGAFLWNLIKQNQNNYLSIPVPGFIFLFLVKSTILAKIVYHGAVLVNSPFPLAKWILHFLVSHTIEMKKLVKMLFQYSILCHVQLIWAMQFLLWLSSPLVSYAITLFFVKKIIVFKIYFLLLSWDGLKSLHHCEPDKVRLDNVMWGFELPPLSCCLYGFWLSSQLIW